MITEMINLSDGIGCKRPIYINILHSLRGQEHDINYQLAFFVLDLITGRRLFWAGSVYLNSGGGGLNGLNGRHNNV